VISLKRTTFCYAVFLFLLTLHFVMRFVAWLERYPWLNVTVRFVGLWFDSFEFETFDWNVDMMDLFNRMFCVFLYCIEEDYVLLCGLSLDWNDVASSAYTNPLTPNLGLDPWIRMYLFVMKRVLNTNLWPPGFPFENVALMICNSFILLYGFVFVL
jgi:hypothetical protein